MTRSSQYFNWANAADAWFVSPSLQELVWVSQYPHEVEICFPPHTGCEVRGVRVEGAVMVVSVRLSVNMTSPTIEDVVTRMQTSH
eukprot:4550154-Prymnesium_polylepis.1